MRGNKVRHFSLDMVYEILIQPDGVIWSPYIKRPGRKDEKFTFPWKSASESEYEPCVILSAGVWTTVAAKEHAVRNIREANSGYGRLSEKGALPD